ncbi:hypothetical protein FACS1894201_09230 [Bacteroidia bacterium]|nr:hypothetical protein FACS1894201_09230 [Bacteroidia bacterium]
MGRKDIPFEQAIDLLSDFYTMGARKVTFMGGEPFLYYNDHNKFFELILAAKNIGYTYLRADSNGQNSPELYSNDTLTKLDDLSFSLDGYNKKINDILRGEKSFENCVNAIKVAIQAGIKVELTCCVHPQLLKIDNGELGLHRMIRFAESLGCRAINFHVLFKHGFPMDTWTAEDTANSPEEWIKIRNLINTGDYKIKVRIPTQFISQEEFNAKPRYYAYCPVKLGERALIHPDGQIRVCSGMIASKYCIGKFTDKNLIWEDSMLNESLDHKFDEHTPCTNQSKCKDYGNLLPVCFSFKPYQKEFVWNEHLKWDNNDKHTIE